MCAGAVRNKPLNMCRASTQVPDEQLRSRLLEHRDVINDNATLLFRTLAYLRHYGLDAVVDKVRENLTPEKVKLPAYK